MKKRGNGENDCENRIKGKQKAKTTKKDFTTDVFAT